MLTTVTDGNNITEIDSRRGAAMARVSRLDEAGLALVESLLALLDADEGLEQRGDGARLIIGEPNRRRRHGPQ